MSATADQVRAEEREAAAQHRHMQRMQREAQRAHEARMAEARREGHKRRREELSVAEREAREACRVYGKALTEYAGCSDRRAEVLGARLDRTYAAAMRACEVARMQRVQLMVGCWS